MQTLNISVETFLFADLQLCFAKLCKHKYGVHHRRDVNEEDMQLWRCKFIPWQRTTSVTARSAYGDMGAVRKEG